MNGYKSSLHLVSIKKYIFSFKTRFMTVLELQFTLDFYIHYPLDKKVYHCCWNCQFWCSESSIHFRHELFHRCRSIARIINYIEKWSNYIGAYDKSISLHKIVLDIHTTENYIWKNIFSQCSINWFEICFNESWYHIDEISICIQIHFINNSIKILNFFIREIGKKL